MHNAWVMQQSRAALSYCRLQSVRSLLNDFLTSKSFYRVILPFLKKYSEIFVKQKSDSHGLSSELFSIFFLDEILYTTISKINRVIRDTSSVLILGFCVALGA